MRLGTVILAAWAALTKAARTPASIMLVHRWAGCSRNGRGLVKRPSSTILSQPPQAELTSTSNAPASPAMRANGVKGGLEN